MNRKISSHRLAGFLCLLSLLVATSAAAQSVVSTVSFSPPGVTNNVGFNFEVAVVHSTGLVYSGAAGDYGSEVGVIDPTTKALAAVIPLPTSGILDFALVNQSTGLIYFRQRSFNSSSISIVVIDGRLSSPTFNQVLPPLTLSGQVQSFALDETRGLLYVTNNTTGTVPVQSRVSIIDVNPVSPTFHRVLDEVPIPVGDATLAPPGGIAFGIAVNSITNKVYLGVRGGLVGGIYLLDNSTKSLTRIPGSGGARPSVALNQSANLIYVTRSTNELIVIDGVTDTILATIISPDPIADIDERLAIHTGTGRVYVLSSGASAPNKVIVVDGDRLSPTFNTVLAAIDVGRRGIGLVVDENLNRILATSVLDKETTIIDGFTNTAMAVIPSTQQPADIVLNPRTHRAYVANQLNFVQEINVSSASLEATILTAAEAGIGVINPNNHLFYVGRTIGNADVPFFDRYGSGGVVAGLPHGAGRNIFTACNARTNRVYAVNSDANLTGENFAVPGFVSVIDGSTNSVIANVEVGDNPWGIAINEVTNKIYVPNAGFLGQSPSSISIIDGATNTAVRADTSAFPPTARFFGQIVVNETTNKIYFRVPSGAATTIGVLDGATNVATPLPASLGSITAIRINKMLNRVYVASRDNGQLHVLDGATNTEIATLTTGSPGFSGRMAVYETASHLAVNEATGQVFVANFNDDTVTVVDGASNTIVATISVGDGPAFIAVNKLTNRVYVGNENNKTISFIDGRTLMVVSTLAVPLRPGLLVADETTSRIYSSTGVASDQSGVMIIADAADLSVTKTASPDPGTKGSNLSYTITVTNNGPGIADAVSVSDSLPSGTTFVSAAATQGNCTTPAAGASTGTLTCNLGSLANRASATVRMVVNVTALPGATISNTATVRASTSDPNSANNTATVMTEVVAGAPTNPGPPANPGPPSGTPGPPSGPPGRP